MSSYRYRKSHCGDKTVVRSSYLHNGISYTSKMSSLYWIGALFVWIDLVVSRIFLKFWPKMLSSDEHCLHICPTNSSGNLSSDWLKSHFYTLRDEHRVAKDCYSRLLFTSGVSDQMWWRHNAKSEKTILGDNGGMSARWGFIVEWCVDDN